MRNALFVVLMILFSSQVFPTPGAAQSVFDFEPVDDEDSDQSPDSDNLNESEDVLTIEELDEEKISQQQKQQEQAEEIVLEEDLTGETELNSLEKREKVEKGYYSWIGEAKPLTTFGVGFTKKKNDRLFDSLSFGGTTMDFSKSEDGISYDSSFHSFAFTADLTYYPFDEIPLKITYGVSLGYMGGVFKEAEVAGEPVEKDVAFEHYLFTGFGGIGFTKILKDDYFVSMNLLTSTRSVRIGGDTSEGPEQVQEKFETAIQQLRIIGPVNFAVGKFID